MRAFWLFSFFPLFFEVLTRPFSDHLDISAPPKRSAKASRHALVQSPGSLQFSTADGRVPPFSAAFRSLKGTPLGRHPLLWDCLPRGLVLLVLGQLPTSLPFAKRLTFRLHSDFFRPLEHRGQGLCNIFSCIGNTLPEILKLTS